MLHRFGKVSSSKHKSIFWTYRFHRVGAIISPVLVRSSLCSFVRSFFWKHFSPNWGTKAPKIGHFYIFGNFVIFLKTMQNEISLNFWLFIANPMSDKILFLKLIPKMFLPIQITGSFICMKVDKSSYYRFCWS